MKISVDVVIPSFRLEEKYIVPILSLARPANAIITFYIVVDNPTIEYSQAIKSLINNNDIFLIINSENLGAADTRNAGIAAGKGEWILFLDDDIVVEKNLLEVYVNAIIESPQEIGFLGLISFPKPTKDFTRAIEASGSMDIFNIANRKDCFAWGATANAMISRNAAGDIRFSSVYPKSGGGEDVDFFLKIRKENGYKNFKTLPSAVVHHPWWKKEKVDFKRPFRYGKGNSHLGELNPEYAYYDFLNAPEILLVTLAAALISIFIDYSFFIFLLKFISGIILIELIASAVQTFKRFPKANLKVIMFVLALRFVHESGVLAGKISRLKAWRIGERFHDDGKINKLYFYRSNTYRIVKWILYPLLITFLFYH